MLKLTAVAEQMPLARAKNLTFSGGRLSFGKPTKGTIIGQIMENTPMLGLGLVSLNSIPRSSDYGRSFSKKYPDLGTKIGEFSKKVPDPCSVFGNICCKTTINSY